MFTVYISVSALFIVTMDHKFEANRGLSPSGSVFKTVEESLGGVDVDGVAPRGEGIAPEDIWRKRATLCGTVPLLPAWTWTPVLWRLEIGCGIEAKDSPTVGWGLETIAETSWGKEGCEAERGLTSLVRLAL